MTDLDAALIASVRALHGDTVAAAVARMPVEPIDPYPGDLTPLDEPADDYWADRRAQREYDARWEA